MKAIIPVAGKGTRMYPIGVTKHKSLIKIFNKTVLQWNLEHLRANGIDRVALVVSPDDFGEQIRKFVGEHAAQLGLQIEFRLQAEQLGTAHVLQMAADFIDPGEEFVFIYGDDIYGPKSIAKLLETPGLAVSGVTVPDPEKWGIFKAENGRLLEVVEKPKDPVGNLANVGLMKLNSQAFELFSQLKPTQRGEYELTDTLNLLAQTAEVKVLDLADYWLPIGYPWHILDATERLQTEVEYQQLGTVEENVTIKGNLHLPKSSLIKSGSYIEGNVYLGENVVVGPNAFLRGPLVVGDNSKICFSVEVKASVIGENTALPHLSYVGDSVIGDNVNMTSVVTANLRHDGEDVKTKIKGELQSTGRKKFGAVVGDNVKLGVGNLIYPGRKIWPGVSTLPGTIIKDDLESDAN
jgi:UDP-N-acetylglucosamine diphosphorylase/glucosamine-1-phosphate N-acetyltransferase